MITQVTDNNLYFHNLFSTHLFQINPQHKGFNNKIAINKAFRLSKTSMQKSPFKTAKYH